MSEATHLTQHLDILFPGPQPVLLLPISLRHRLRHRRPIVGLPHGQILGRCVSSMENFRRINQSRSIHDQGACQSVNQLLKMIPIFLLQVIVTIMASVGAFSAYATDIIAVQRFFYGQSWNWICVYPVRKISLPAKSRQITG